MPVIRNSRAARLSDARAFAICAVVVPLISVAAVYFFFSRGSLLYFGDAESHLNIARRLIDSRTPGYDQLGTAWLPLLHLLMLPFVSSLYLWRTGLAGAIPCAACFVVAALFLFAAVRRVCGSNGAAGTATALFALNPNALYLQSIPMTEAVFFAALLGTLYFTVCFAQTQSLAAVAGAGLSALAGTLTRYEGWFVLPFVAGFVYLAATRRRFTAVAIFVAITAVGPLWWMSYNWWYFGNAVAFYNGPYSAKAIQGAQYYPGKNDWILATRYFVTAAKLVLGAPLLWIGLIGTVVAIRRRAYWPVVLLALPPFFYIWSMHSSGNPIYVPTLWPHSWYNTRYGLALLPLCAFGAGWWGRRLRLPVIVLAVLPWLPHHTPPDWITWKESQVNSEQRREWTRRGAAFIGARLRPGDTIFTGFSDVTGIYREAGIPLQRTFSVDNGLVWQAAVQRPDLFLWNEWAVAQAGDSVHAAIERIRTRAQAETPAPPRAPRARLYDLVAVIKVRGAPDLEIYRRR